MLREISLLVGLSIGCGPSTYEQDQRRLQEVVGELREQIARQDDRVEELSNRVFVLADRIDSARVDASRSETPPELNVVRLVPDALPAAPPPSPVAIDPSEDEEVVITMGDDGQLSAESVDKPRRHSHESDKRRAPKAESVFLDALASYRQGKVEGAFASFAAFLKRFPRHAYADNARYWMGECRFDAKEYREAIRQFANVIKRYPRSNKVPDALWKMGLAYERLGEVEMAKRAFEDVISGYPRSALSDLARSHLVALAPGGSR